MKDLPDLYAGIEAEVQESLTHLENLFAYAPAASGQAGKNWEIIWGTGRKAGRFHCPAYSRGSRGSGENDPLAYGVLCCYYSVSLFFIADRDRILAFVRSHMPDWAKNTASI